MGKFIVGLVAFIFVASICTFGSIGYQIAKTPYSYPKYQIQWGSNGYCYTDIIEKNEVETMAKCRSGGSVRIRNEAITAIIEYKTGE